MAYDLRITGDEIFQKSAPTKSDELRNVVVVKYFPFVLGAEEEVFTSQEITLAPSATQTVDVRFSAAPCKDLSAAIDPAGSIAVSGTPTWYPWGAALTVVNGSGAEATAKVVVSGKVYKADSLSVTREDAPSISEYGRRVYEYPENKLIQTQARAAEIAEALLASTKQIRRDVSIDWIGTPALELADVIEVPEYQKHGIDSRHEYQNVKTATDYDGTLRQTTEGRRI